MAAEEDAGRVLLLPFLLPLLWIAINEGGGGSSGPASRLIRPKTEPALGPVKCEHNDEAAFDDEAAMKWAREDWARLEMERQRRALEEIAARRCGRDEGGVVVLEDSEYVTPPPVRLGDPWQGSSSVKKEKDDDNSSDDGDYSDYAVFSEFFGL